jgi:hypothetical protein
MSNTEFIVTETPNGRASVKSAFICTDEADFINRINQTAMRGGVWIETVEQAIDYLDERHAQRTQIVRRADFDARTADAWDKAVLDKAEFLGWYEPATEEDGDG